MKKKKNFASKKKIERELSGLDLKPLIRNLENYAKYLLHDQESDKAFDVVSQTFDKIISQERKWYEGNSLISTLFMAVRSLANNENKKLKKKRELGNNWVDIETVAALDQRSQFDELNIAELKSIAMEVLKDHEPPPDYLEELIFECWIEGLIKQQEIASYLDQDIAEIRKGVKRLERKLNPIKDKFVKMGYE